MAAVSSVVTALAAVAGTAASVSAAKKAKMPEIVDPRIERAKAEAEAAQKTSSALAQRNKARQASSLLAKPMDSATSAVPALGATPGKQTLGA